MAFNDRDYQTEAVTSIWTYFATRSGNPIVAMPTGTGKSIVIGRFLQSVYARFPAQRVLMLTHVKELIQQNFEKLKTMWPFAPAGIYSAGLNSRDASQAITFAGIASVAKKWAMFGHVHLVLIDECHLLSPDDETMYQAFIAGLKSINPMLKVIGFTATPWRLGHGKLTDPKVKIVDGEEVEIPSLFTDVCFDITGIEAFNRLIAEGYLLPLVPKRMKTVLDVDGVHMRGGEFIEKELQTAVDKDEITEAALNEAIQIGEDRHKWLIFAAGTEHADNIGEMLNMMGIPTGVVHSKREGRDQTIADFKAGRLRAVVNNNVLTTGFDEPGIDMIIVLRPTASAVLWVQMLGRGTRPFWTAGYDLDTLEGRIQSIKASTKHDCLVLDYAANTKRLGPINDPLVPRRKGQGGGDAPVKCCERCDTWVHASLRNCPICGFEFTFETKLKQSASSEKLIKGDNPIVEVFKVDHVTVEKHTKVGAPPMVRINYYCGLKRFSEFVCPEHQNWAQKKARAWWKARSPEPMPESTDEVLEATGMLPPATHLRIWINKPGGYPEILATCLDGTAFGAIERSDSWEPPPVETELRSQLHRSVILEGELSRSNAPFYSADDDIPF